MACKRRRKYTTMDFAIWSLLSSAPHRCERFGSILGIRGAHHGWQPERGATTWRRQNTWACADGAGGGGRRLWQQQWRDKDIQAGGKASRLLLRQESWGGAHASQHSGKQLPMHDPTCPHGSTMRSSCSSSSAWSRGARPDERRKGEGQGRGNALDMLTCRTSRLACAISHLCTPHPHPQVASRPIEQAFRASHGPAETTRRTRLAEIR